ncbi:MAG: sugar ABC transporter substrate-binding protein [Chloroflexi bacterium]|nr:sugar ABC transporter substrate-binding protein [Chloroflexota bacterium]
MNGEDTNKHSGPATRRALFHGAAGAAAATPMAALAACAPSERGEAPAVRPLGAAALQLGYRPDPADEEILQGDFLPKFEAANPGVKVEILTVTGNYNEKVIAMFAGGTPPDLLWVSHAIFPAWTAKGLLRRIGELAKRDGRRLKLDDFYPPMLEAARFKGELYGLPYLGGIFIVNFNRRQFQQAGVPLPSDLAQQGKWTEAAFLDAARRVTRASGGEVSVFGANATLSYTSTAPWLWGNGADFFNRDSTAMAIDTPAAQATLQFQADLVHKHRVAPKPGETVSGGRRVNFQDETQAMSVGWSTGSRNLLAKPDLDWDAAPMPKGSVRSLSMYGYNPLSITAPSKNVDAAWELIGHLTGPYVVRTWTERGRIMATRKSAGEQAKFIDELPPGFRTLARNGALASRANPIVVAHDEVERVVQPEFTAIARGEKSVGDAVQAMKRLADPLLKAG